MTMRLFLKRRKSDLLSKNISVKKTPTSIGGENLKIRFEQWDTLCRILRLQGISLFYKMK